MLNTGEGRYMCALSTFIQWVELTRTAQEHYQAKRCFTGDFIGQQTERDGSFEAINEPKLVSVRTASSPRE